MRGIHKKFPGVTALDDVDFDLIRGEAHVLLGENGAGKSTLMKILSGAYQKSAGRILFEGRGIEIHSPRHAQELGISTVYQELNLVPHLSVAANIFLGREPARSGVINDKRLHVETQDLLDTLGLSLNTGSLVTDLSIAQQQMIEVARALSWSAKILIMDEPTSALTDREISQLFVTIRRLKEKGVAIIYISHRLEELFEIGDRVTVLRDGKYVGTRDVAEVGTGELIQMMVERPLTEQYPKQFAAYGEEVLRIENLYSSGRLHNVSLSLKRGEVLGIAGLLGAGRTDLARAIFGLDPLESGQIYVRDEPKTIRSPRYAINLGIGFLTEDRKSQGLVLILSVKDNIVLASLERLSKLGVVDRNQETEVASRFVDDLGIKTPGLQQKAMFLSGGNQQKVVLSKWLCSQADILIFDEPTRGVDVGAKVELYQLMNALTSNGAAIIMISSELPEILGMSDRILVMHNGGFTGEFSRAEATQERILQCALGEAIDN
jgi:ribose transport system ATP-binding protein